MRKETAPRLNAKDLPRRYSVAEIETDAIEAGGGLVENADAENAGNASLWFALAVGAATSAAALYVTLNQRRVAGIIGALSPVFAIVAAYRGLTGHLEKGEARRIAYH